MGRQHRRSNPYKSKSTSNSTPNVPSVSKVSNVPNIQNIQQKPSFMGDVLSTSTGYVIGNSISRMLFGNSNKESNKESDNESINKDNVCYEKFEKYNECIKTAEFRDRKYNNEECSTLLEEFNKCYYNNK